MTKKEPQLREGQNVNVLKERNVLDWKLMKGAEFRTITSDLYALRSTLTCDGLYPRTLAISMQENRTKSMIESDLVEKEKWLKCLSETAAKKKEDLSEVKKELEEAKKPLEEAKTKLQKEEKILNKARCDTENLSNRLADAKKTYDSMNRIVLVHKSATLSQIAIHKYESIFVTEPDSTDFFELNKKMDNLICVNGIFEEKDVEGFVTKLPYYFYTKYNRDEQKSLLIFCEMVIYFKMAEDRNEVNIVFSNKDILEILRMNGLDL